jgi:N-hydroxyarylamine O-acetyltransferase
MPFTATHVAAYLKRIGYAGPVVPSLQMLNDINRLHTAAIPFENIDVVLGRPVHEDVQSMYRKLVENNRGGYCFEHALPLLEILRAIGFRAHALAGRVLWQAPKDAPMPPPTHLELNVAAPEGPHLLDVAFGGLTLTAPIPFVTETICVAGREPVRLMAAGPEFDLQVQLQSEWTPLYRIASDPLDTAAISRMNRSAWSNPESIFTRALICARVDETRRYNLLNDRLNVRSVGGDVELRRISTGRELADLLKTTFGISPPSDVETLWG